MGEETGVSHGANVEPGSDAGRPAGGTIVVGYTTKPEGRAALDRAMAEAQDRSARLVVVNTGPAEEAEGLPAWLADHDVDFEIRAVTDDLDPAELLIRAAEESAAEFIVIGLRRRSPLGKLLLGSNAQRVLLDAPCPVLAVKAD